MAAVLRVKRRYDDEPLDALVIACKRIKTEENVKVQTSGDTAPAATVLKFAGTINNQNENVAEHLMRLSKDELKANYKQHPLDVLAKSRETVKQKSVENRYKVINCFRSLDTSNIDELEDKVMTVIDVEDSISCAVLESTEADKDETYVYDLYYAQTGSDVVIDESVSIHALDQEFVYDTYTTPEIICESEDSNSESNWRNDYPDTEPSSEGSINEDDMKEAMMNMKLEDDSDLSSEEDFAYALDEGDVEQFGYKYAKYKAKIKEFEEGDSDLSEYSATYISEEPNDDEDDKV